MADIKGILKKKIANNSKLVLYTWEGDRYN